jgi:hypothetical protein
MKIFSFVSVPCGRLFSIFYLHVSEIVNIVSLNGVELRLVDSAKCTYGKLILVSFSADRRAG